MTPSTPKPLRIENLGKSYDDGHWALQDISVSIPSGSVLAVLGPSGSGKSTLLNLVAGLQVPTTGQINIGETVMTTPTQHIRPERRDISMVFQDFALWPHMSVRRIVGYGLRYGVNKIPTTAREARVDELLELLQLRDLGHRRPAELSGGQQQRVAIARALATRPSLLLFDEPLSNLDSQLRQEMRDELGELFGELDITVLYVTHDFSEALALADKILILEKGRTVQYATPEEIFAHPANPWAANLAGFTIALRPDRVQETHGDVEMQFGTTWMQATPCGTGWNMSPDGDFKAVVHPDGVELTSSGELAGTVQSSFYEGRRWRNRITSEGVGTIVAFSSKKLIPGTSVRYSFDPEFTLVYHPARAQSAVPHSSRKPTAPQYV